MEQTGEIQQCYGKGIEKTGIGRAEGRQAVFEFFLDRRSQVLEEPCGYGNGYPNIKHGRYYRWDDLFGKMI